MIEVRVAGRGKVREGTRTLDEEAEARCDLCDREVDAVASTGAEGEGPFACKACLRGRLEAITLAAWELRDPSDRGLPWGKVSG
ncbi:MAG: hypothetical protein EVA89_31160 [Sandaracinaceae bacterium]|nr:MAG: hypothetical protein EVA89_31160 [Sandaracinaceae bacterium]